MPQKRVLIQNLPILVWTFSCSINTKLTFVVALPSVRRMVFTLCILLNSWHLKNMIMPYIRHMGGSFFPGLLRSQSSIIDNILATSICQPSISPGTNHYIPCFLGLMVRLSWLHSSTLRVLSLACRGKVKDLHSATLVRKLITRSMNHFDIGFQS